MAKIPKLIEGYREFYDTYFVKQPDVYKTLLKNGQSPKTLVIACSDSRVDPAILLNARPGDIFVIRNVANLVPPYEQDKHTLHGTSAAIEFAVEYLNIESILIIGHEDCGGIKALLNDHKCPREFIDDWLEIIQFAKDKTRLSEKTHESSCETCAKEAIRISLKNLETFPFIKRKIEQGKLELHGWYFSLESGKIEII